MSNQIVFVLITLIVSITIAICWVTDSLIKGENERKRILNRGVELDNERIAMDRDNRNNNIKDKAWKRQ